MPFSMGKRRCPGEGFARANLFLFFSGLLQEFSFQPSVAGRPPSEDYRPGISLRPQEFTVSTALCPLHPEYCTPYLPRLRQMLGMRHPDQLHAVSET